MAACAPHRFLANNRNVLRQAILAASSVLPVSNNLLEEPLSRDGSAQAEITGEFTGAEEAKYEIEVTGVEIDNNLVSAPVFSGVGSGALRDVVAGGVPQRYSVTLSDAGTPETNAAMNYENGRIVARVAGEAGNDITITVDQSALVFSSTIYSLLVDLATGAGGATTGLVGNAYDWDTKALTTIGQIPVTAHRIAFADDTSRIYLAYKRYDGIKWLYHFVPEIQRAVPKGTPIKFVTEGRTVTISNGVDPDDVLEDIVTSFDLLNAIQTGSTLVRFDGVVANDRSPTGQASRELLLRTDAHAEPATGKGSPFVDNLDDVEVAADAPTELVTLKCFAINADQSPNAHIGAELWAVKGSLSGRLAEVAVTGLPYSHPDGRWGFTIPRKFPDGPSQSELAKFAVSSINYMPRTEAQGSPPPICVVAMALGPNAIDQTITLRYTPRVVDNCDCSDMPVPFLDANCLGEVIDEGAVMSDYSPDNRERLMALYSWQADLVRAHSTHGSGQGDYDQAPLFTRPITRRALDTIRDERVGQYDHNGSLTYGEGGWQNAATITARSVYDDSGNAYFPGHPEYDQRNLVSYTPFETESLLSMSQRFERTLADLNALPQTSIRSTGEAAWDTAFDEFKDDVELQLTPTPYAYSLFGNEVADPEDAIEVQAIEAIAAGDLVLVYRLPATEDELRVRKWVPGVEGAMGFTKNAAVGSPLTVGVYFAGINDTVVVEASGAVVGGTLYGGSVVEPGAYVAKTADPDVLFYRIGTGVQALTVSHDPNYSGLTRTSGTGENRLAILADRYRTRLHWVLISGGISPLGKFDASTFGSGDGCWRDFGDSSWWTVTGSERGAYAPAFNNRVCYLSKKDLGTKMYVSTHEAAFQVNVRCPGKLLPGDEIVLSINGAGKASSYQVGDEFELPIESARPFQLSGGRDGDSTQLWYVFGSVDGALQSFLSGGSPNIYDNGTLSFRLEEGGIPFALGDRFEFEVEGGSWRWRKIIDGVVGSWSSGGAITANPQLFDAGLSLRFIPGAAPSFVVGDIYSFIARQSWAASNVKLPDAFSWRWSGSSATLVCDLGSEQDVSMFAVALHTLPAGAGVMLEGGVAPGVYTWQEDLEWLPGTIFSEFETQTARYLRLTVLYAPDASIGWLWAGTPFTTAFGVDVKLRRQYNIGRSSRGLFGGGRSLGKAVGGSVAWTEGMLSEAEIAELNGMLDWVKDNSDEPFIFVPQVNRTELSLFARVLNDEVDVEDIYEHGLDPSVAAERQFSATLPLTGVWQ